LGKIYLLDIKFLKNIGSKWCLAATKTPGQSNSPPIEYRSKNKNYVGLFNYWARKTLSVKLLFGQMIFSIKWPFSQMTIFRNKFSVKWPFSQTTRLNHISVKWPFIEKRCRSNDLSIKQPFDQMTIYRKKLSFIWLFGPNKFRSNDSFCNFKFR
jgi:hypothetical protein